MRLVRVAAAAVAGIAVLAGCSGGETANETLPSTSSGAAETSASLPPLGPPDFPVPGEAREQTPAGIEAFTAYYLNLTDYLLPTLDSQPIRELSDKCEACEQLADGYDADRAAGNKYSGGDISIMSTGSALVEDERGEISFLLHQSAVTVTDRAAAVMADRSSTAYDLSGGMTLRWDASKVCWLVTELTAERLP